MLAAVAIMDKMPGFSAAVVFGEDRHLAFHGKEEEEEESLDPRMFEGLMENSHHSVTGSRPHDSASDSTPNQGKRKLLLGYDPDDDGDDDGDDDDDDDNDHDDLLLSNLEPLNHAPSATTPPPTPVFANMNHSIPSGAQASFNQLPVFSLNNSAAYFAASHHSRTHNVAVGGPNFPSRGSSSANMKQRLKHSLHTAYPTSLRRMASKRRRPPYQDSKPCPTYVSLDSSCAINSALRCEQSPAESLAVHPLLITKENPQQLQEDNGTNSLLHRACCRPDVTCGEIRTILRRDPESASRPVKIMTIKSIYSIREGCVVSKEVREPYVFPLNLAIKAKAQTRVIEMLVEASPSVLRSKDGSMNETTLAILLKYLPSDVELFDVELLDNIVMKYPQSIFELDRHQNTVVHTATVYGAGLKVLRRLAIMFPKSLHMKNFQGKTPVNLAQQRAISCDPHISSFLQGMQLKYPILDSHRQPHSPTMPPSLHIRAAKRQLQNY